MLRRLIKKAQTDKFGFYSRAEEIALNLPQKKMRGDDARRMFKKMACQILRWKSWVLTIYSSKTE